MKTIIKNAIDYRGEALSPETLLKKLESLAFCLTNENGYFIEVNSAYLDLYGYAEEELLGKHFTIVVPEESRTYACQAHDDFIAGAVEIPAEWIVKRKDGEAMRVYVEAIRCEDPNGRPAKITFIERV